MQRNPVAVSRLVLSFGYDPDTNTLEVEHRNGEIWQFWPVDYSVYIGLQLASQRAKYGPKSFDNHFKKRVLYSGCNRKKITPSI